VPTLAVHGEADPIADVGAVRAYAEQIEALRLHAVAGGRHDILNDTAHREVAAAIVEFVGERL
jgi:alpha-beta hydrolase superfamily lysophospholipase